MLLAKRSCLVERWEARQPFGFPKTLVKADFRAVVPIRASPFC